MRRYEVAAVRRRAVGRALPRAYLQADLDLVAPPAASLNEAALAEAEVIKVHAPLCLSLLFSCSSCSSIQCRLSC